MALARLKHCISRTGLRRSDPTPIGLLGADETTQTRKPTANSMRSMRTTCALARWVSSKPGGGSHRPPVVTHCSDLSGIPLNVDELLTVLEGPFDSPRDREADRGPRRLRVMRLVYVVARPEEPENDEDGCHVTAGDECRDEGTHWNLSLLYDSALLHCPCRADGGRITRNCR